MIDNITITTVIPHLTDIGVSINEYILTHTVNRNVKKLLENDITLYELYKDVLGGIDISEYKIGNSYDYGKLVWFQDRNKKLWLIQSIYNANTNNPQIPINKGGSQTDFEEYGWKNLNETVDLKSLGVDKQLDRYILEKLDIHQEYDGFHKLGYLGKESEINKKVLKRDLSNVDENRSNIFYPYMSGHFSDDTILNGTYRVWDCGLLEMNIIYRFGYVKTDENGYDIIECNNCSFNPSLAKSKESDDYTRNSDYFSNLEDMKIFRNLENDQIYESTIGVLKQTNRNNYVNTYFAKLNLFQKPIHFSGNKINGFKDINYTVFQCDNLAEDCDRTELTMNMSKNQIVFCDKKTKSLTAILVTYPKNETTQQFGKYGGLASNSFSCKIVGRWK